MLACILRPIMLGLLVFGSTGPASADELDLFVQTQIDRRQIPGLSLAIIRDGRIVATRTYGTTTRNGKAAVTPSTLFQAGSISKPVSALGALRLVEARRLSLDEDVNARLKSWHLPENEFTKAERVTLRRILSHTAGISVRGFPGYEVTERVPSLLEVLDGKGNTAPITVDSVPGRVGRYSGGGFIVMQKLIEDVSGKPFAEYMQDQVLRPLGMTNSTFQQPLTTELAGRAATGYGLDRSEIPGRWHVYPEMAAAGLWTTPTDLAKYAIGVQQALAGKSKVLSADMARQMLTVERDGYGLGPWMDGNGPTRRFGFNGRVRGFNALVIASVVSGDGLVVMINTNDNTGLSQGNRIIDFVAKKYNWPGYFEHDAQRVPPTPEVVRPVDASLASLAALTGGYDNNLMVLKAQGGHVYSYADGLPDEEFAPAGDDRFVSTERAVSFKLLRNPDGDVEAVEWNINKTTRRMPRIGPLFSTLGPSDDPDPAFTRSVPMLLNALAGCAKTVDQLTGLTQGLRNWCISLVNPGDYTSFPAFRSTRAVTFLHANQVAGRGIDRLGHPVDRILHYRIETDRGDRWLLLYIAASGLVADWDTVED